MSRASTAVLGYTYVFMLGETVLVYLAAPTARNTCATLDLDIVKIFSSSLH